MENQNDSRGFLRNVFYKKCVCLSRDVERSLDRKSMVLDYKVIQGKSVTLYDITLFDPTIGDEGAMYHFKQKVKVKQTLNEPAINAEMVLA